MIQTRIQTWWETGSGPKETPTSSSRVRRPVRVRIDKLLQLRDTLTFFFVWPDWKQTLPLRNSLAPATFQTEIEDHPRGSMQLLVILSTNPTKFQDIGLHPSKWQKTEGYGHRSPILAPSESKNNAESCSLTCSRFNFHPSHRGFHWKWRQIFTGGGKYAMTHWHRRWSLAAWPKSGIGKSASSSSENRTRGKNCGDRHATTEQYRCSTISTCRSESYRYYKLSSFLIGSSEPTGLKDSKG